MPPPSPLVVSTTPPAPTKPAEMLTGKTLTGDWRVLRKLPISPCATGSNFSVGYIVEDADGREAFLKALDYSRALSSPDPARMLQALTEAYNFERDILNKCKHRRMSRVVTALADGSVAVATSRGVEIVQYLIFEKAEKDSRALLATASNFDAAWALRAMHHIANGLQQMHLNLLAHQDLKPSNVLLFGEDSSKIGDLGRAADRGATAPHDFLASAGDPAYAPPEGLYGHVESDWNARRMGCDLYLLGSMLLFFFTQAAATPAIFSKMIPAHYPGNWGGTYPQVLPFVRDAFDRVANEFEHTLSPSLKTLLPVIFRQLCDPDPKLRGHPMDRTGAGNAYSLQRYVGKLDNIARRAELTLLP